MSETQTPPTGVSATVTTKQKASANKDAAPQAASAPPIADAPDIETPVPVVTKVKAALVAPPVVVTLSHDASTVQSLLTEYAALMGKVIVNQAAISRGIALLARATQVVLDTTQDDARDVLWDFQQAHKNDLMSESMALRGLKNLQGAQAMRVSMTYTLIRHKILDTNIPLDDTKAIGATSRSFVIWLGTKR